MKTKVKTGETTNEGAINQPVEEDPISTYATTLHNRLDGVLDHTLPNYMQFDEVANGHVSEQQAKFEQIKQEHDKFVAEQNRLKNDMHAIKNTTTRIVKKTSAIIIHIFDTTLEKVEETCTVENMEKVRKKAGEFIGITLQGGIHYIAPEAAHMVPLVKEKIKHIKDQISEILRKIS